MAPKEIDIPEEAIQRRSAADFFHDNKAIAGFDNSLRVVFTSVRELVENGLDAAEKIQRLPEMFIKIEILQASEIEKLLQVKKYQKEERLDFIKLTVRDNGMGVAENSVPDLFGRVLTGSNYGARQSRGRFGLGAKMVLLNAMATVDLPIIVTSRYFKEKTTSRHDLFINLQKNEPIIKKKDVFPANHVEAFKKSGTEVIVTFTGSWTLAKRYIKDYFHSLAIITPYAELKIELPDNEYIHLERVVDEMPEYPETTKIHPWGVDITQLKREIDFTKKTDMVDFLVNHFEGITPKKARNFLEFVNVPEKTNPKSLASSDIRRIVHDGFQTSLSSNVKGKKKDQIKRFTFIRPSGAGLSPLGEDRLKRGLIRELNPEIAESVSRPVGAYGGHPFVIEATIAYGGKQLEDETPTESGSKDSKNARIYRFANRIPLLFGAGNDIVTKVIFDDKNLSWKDYKININSAPIAIAVSLVSTKIPFPETSKEYIADVKEIREELVQALKTLGSRVRTFLSRKERSSREKQRKSRFELYAPKVSKSLSEILHSMPSEILPFDLSNIENLMSRALVEATPKSFRRYKPPSPPIYSLRSWAELEGRVRRDLDDLGIVTGVDFLFTDNEHLNKSKLLSEERIREIKQVSVKRLDLSPASPKVSELKLMPSWIEKGFQEFEKIEKSLSRRWLSTIWDFFATKNEYFLFVVGLIDKISYSEKHRLIQLAKKKGLLNNENFLMSSLKWVTPEMDSDFKSKGISTKAEFLIKFKNELLHKANIPALQKYFLRFIKSDVTKTKILNDNITAVGVNWLSGDSKKALNSKLKLKTWQDLIDEIDAHPKNLIELDILIDSILDELKEKVLGELNEEEKAKIGLDKILDAEPEYLEFLDRKKIRNLYDFIAIEADKLDKNHKIYLINKFRKEILTEYNTKFPMYLEKLVWIPPAIEEKLTDSHILTVYDFLITPIHVIKETVGDLMEVEFIKEIKTQWGIPLNYLDPDLRAEFHENNFQITEEIMHLEKEQVLNSKAKPLWKDIEYIQNTLNSPIVAFPNFPPNNFASVIQHGIISIYDFLIWPEDEYNKLKMSLIELLTLKQQINLEQINTSVKELTISLDNIKIVPKSTKQILNQYNVFNVENVLFLKDYQIIPKEITEKNKEELQQAINEVRRLLNSPVVYLPYVDPVSIRKFINVGIRKVSDFIFWPIKELESLIPEVSNISTSRKTIDSFLPGRSLKESSLLSPSIVRQLASVDIRTIEDIYFTLHPSTFAVEGIDWSDIRAVRQVLDLPVGLIVFDSRKKGQKSTKKKQPIPTEDNETEEIEQKEISLYEPISPDLVLSLQMQSIHTILEFMIIPPEKLADLIGDTFEEIVALQSRVKIKSQEDKFPIEDDVMGIDKKLRRELESIEITTIEDLYFISSDIFEENPELSDIIQQLRSALDIPLTVLEEFTPKMVQILEKRQISTLIHFIMYPNDKLADLLEVSEERIEEGIKRQISLVDISRIVAYPISTIKDLSQKHQVLLKHNGIYTIAELLRLKTSKNKILHDEPAINNVLQEISIQQIQNLVEESQLVMIQILGKQMTQRLQSKGITTLEDIVMISDEKRDELGSDEELWRKIKLIRDQLKLPADYIVSSKYRSSVQTCALNDIVTVLDFLAVSTEEVENLGVSEDELTKIKKSLQLENILPFFRIPIVSFPVFKPYITFLHENDIETIGEFLYTPPKEIKNIIKLGEFNEKDFYNTFSFWDTIESLNIPITYVMDLDQNIVTNLGRRKISTLMDWWKTPTDTLTSLLSVDEYELNQMWNNLNWESIWESLSYPVAIDDNIPGTWKINAKGKIEQSLGKVLTQSNSEIQKLFDTAERNVKPWKSKITCNDILTQYKSSPRKQLYSAFAHYYKIDKGSNKSSTLYEREIDGKLYNLVDLKIKWEIPIQSLSDIPINITTKLLQANLNLLKDLYLFSENDLEKYVGLDTKSIKLVLDKTWVPNVNIKEKALQSIEKFTFVSDSLKTNLEKFGFKYLSDLKKSTDAPEDIQKDIKMLYRVSKTPILFITNISDSEVNELLENNIYTIEQLYFSTEEKEFSSLKEKIKSSNDIEKSRAVTGLTRDLYNALSDSLQASLSKQLGFDDFCLEEIAFTNITPNPEISLNKSDAMSLEKFLSVFFTQINNLSLIYDQDPSLIEKLHSMDIKYLFQFLRQNNNIKMLSEKSGVPSTKIRYIFNNLDFVKISVSIKKDSVDLSVQNNLVRLSEKDISFLNSIGIFTMQEMFNPQTYIISKSDLNELEKLIKNNTLLNPHDISIARIKGIPLSDINKLRNIGIKSLKDFIIVPGSVIRQNSKIKATEIGTIKIIPQILEKEVIQTKIDKLFKLEPKEELKLKQETSSNNKSSSKKESKTNIKRR